MTFDGSHRTFNPGAEYVQDWRGNTYRLYESLDKPCDMPDCDADAVRLMCEAHPERRGMTHWHGSVHDVKHALWSFCREHGYEAQHRTFGAH